MFLKYIRYGRQLFVWTSIEQLPEQFLLIASFYRGADSATEVKNHLLGTAATQLKFNKDTATSNCGLTVIRPPLVSRRQFSSRTPGQSCGTGWRHQSCAAGP